ncbi:hypothetical protein [Zavarzinia sp. CC-PAN008]|uniref:hypothetical protein n=1 Tax=Zavarzinia sp. CC-PAN008 TaxID=3243332 RepID=UPI003F748E1D
MAMSYEAIRKLVSRSERRDGALHLTFLCPETGAHVIASVDLDGEGARGVGAARGAVAQAIRFGTRRPDRSDQPGAGLEDQGPGDVAERDAVVRAFRKVHAFFSWDPVAQRWSAARIHEDAGPMIRQLHAHPVHSDAEQELLVRILADIAQADGKADAQEMAFLEEIAAVDDGTARRLAGLGRPSLNDLAVVSDAGTRRTMLMLAWALAFTDEELKPGERQELEYLRGGLGISANQAAELRQAAARFVLDTVVANTLASGPVLAWEMRMLHESADHLGLPAEEVELSVAAHRRRFSAAAA